MNRTLAVLVALAPSLLCAAPRQLQLTWPQLGWIMDEKVATVLPDGTHIEGKVVAVQPEGLRLRISKTSDRKAMPKGDQLIPRASISVLRVTEHRVVARPLCALGFAGAAAAIVLSGTSDLYEGPAMIIRPAVGVIGSIGMGVAGYYVGKRLDRKVTEIKIVREDRNAAE